MKETQNRHRIHHSSYKAILFLNLILSVSLLTGYAQQPAPTDAEAMQQRLARARALAAAHNLTAAAFELDAIRTSTTDGVVRDVARIMLMGIYLEQCDYGRAQNLLEETFKAHAPQNEGSSRSYFAVAGQTIKGVRAHLERYRAFGLNIVDRELPSEAISDLDKVRGLLERVIQQAKEIGAGDDRNTDAFALLEDVANVRAGLSRNLEERAQWQSEVAEARQRLAASESRMTSMSGSLASASPAPVLVASKSTIPASENASISKPSGGPQKPETSISGPGDAAAKPVNGQPLNIGPLVEKAMQRVAPTYPTFAKNARVTGIVRVDLVIDEKGAVATANSSSGPEVLRQAAIDAARRWKFRPTVKDGQPVRVTGFLNFNFTL